MDNYYTSKPKEIFHVHTYRCKHASYESEQKYVEAAIELGAERIVFTDHAPFPGDPFAYRMDYRELPEYIEAINDLKTRFQDRIEVLCGLEIEYLPSYRDYIRSLRNMKGIDILALGQHFYEIEPGKYSFSNKDKANEYMGLCNAIIEGIQSSFFDVVVHPDRSFRHVSLMEERHLEFGRYIITEARKKNIPLEKNYSSMITPNLYREEFWNIIKDNSVIYGIDAHSVSELQDGYREIMKIKQLEQRKKSIILK